MRNVSTAAGVEFTRVNNDVNGNPRYVCHYTNFITLADTQKQGYEMGNDYSIAIKKANKLGGRKFHNKQYGGGIVFQSYNIEDLARRIKELVKG